MLQAFETCVNQDDRELTTAVGINTRAEGSSCLASSPIQDFQERGLQELLTGYTSSHFRLLFSDGAAVDRAQEEIQQTLSSGTCADAPL
jgi:hypothetical protein